jgi:uncharacterized membrane protein YkoI
MVQKSHLLFCVLLLASTTAMADKLDQELVRKLKQSGDIVSLETLLSDVRTRHSGHVLEVELEFEHNRYVYEIEMVDDNGEVWEFYYDARDGRFLKQSGGEEDEKGK